MCTETYTGILASDYSTMNHVRLHEKKVMRDPFNFSTFKQGYSLKKGFL
jgi:hypothetical protein